MADQEFVGVVRKKRLVWDLPLRLFHWLLAISIGLLWLTQTYSSQPVPGLENIVWLQNNAPQIAYATFMNVHMWLGYWVIGLIVFRILWGFVGPRHARFAYFFPLPGRVMTYVRSYTHAGKGSPKPVGHNPLGGAMVFLMLALVALQAVTGLFADDDIFTSGPYAAAVSADTADFLNGVHHSLFDYILIAIGLHVLAIVFYAVALKQHLTMPMITGRKPADIVPETEAISSSQWIRAVIVIAVSTVAVWILLAAAPQPSFDF